MVAHFSYWMQQSDCQLHSMASINIATDLLVLALPMPVLRKLHLNSRRRCKHSSIIIQIEREPKTVLTLAIGALLGIFSAGGVAIVASILRFYALYKYATTKDVAYDAIFVCILDFTAFPQYLYTPLRLTLIIYILLWSQIEVNLAIISASAPALRPLFKKTFDNSSDRSSHGYKQSSGSIFPSNTRGRANGTIELHDLNERNETSIMANIKRGKGASEIDNSSQEYILQEGSRKELRMSGKIVMTVETSVESR